MLFPAARVLAAGDIFSGKNIPLLDYNNGGSGAEIPDTLMKAYTGTVKDVDAIVTGHSTVMTPSDLREYAEFNRDFRDAVREGKKNGRSAAAIAKGWTLPERYKGYAPPDADEASGQHREYLQGSPVELLTPGIKLRRADATT